MFTTAEQIIGVLTELGERLDRQGLEAEIYIVGGAAMLLGYDRRVVTRDIDAVLLPASAIDDVASEMAADRGDLPPRWLNDAVVPLLPRVADSRRWELMSVPGLTVQVASPEHLLAMKARACRGPRDLEDIAVLCEVLGVTRTSEVWQICDSLWGDDMISAEVRELVTKGAVGPLDGFISAKTRNRFSALLRLVQVEDKKDPTIKKWQAQYDFGDKVDLGTVEPYWTDPTTGAGLCEVGSSHVLREPDSEKPGAWKQTFRIGRLMCQKAITREHAIELVRDGKTGVIEGFISKKGRPFNAMLKREGAKFSWEFPPRAPKLDKDGKPVVRKAKAPPDLAKAEKIGESKGFGGAEVLVAGDSYYVRRTDQNNRIVFTMKRHICQKEIPPAELMRLLDEGRTNLIEGLISKRGSPFSAFLVLSKTKTKADFEFPPR